jgi:hypothetical protein
MPRSIRIQVLSDALPLKVVPIGVTMVANICALKNHFYFMCMTPRMWVYARNDRSL